MDFGKELVAALPRVRKYVRHLVNAPADDPDDIVQDTMLRALASRHLYTEEGHMVAWLCSIARNIWLDGKRKARKRRMEELHDNEFCSHGADGHDALYCRQVIVGIDALNVSSADVLQRIVMGETYEEIAAVTCVPIGTVRSRVNRARTALSSILEPV